MLDIDEIIKDVEKKAKTKEAVKFLIRNNAKLLIQLEQPDNFEERIGYWKGIRVAQEIIDEISDGMYLAVPKERK